MENVGRTDTFRMPDEHVEMRCSVAPTSVRKGEATAHCVHTDGRGVDVQSYASPPYSREHQQQRGLAKVVTGPAGEIQLFSKIARFPALKEARRIGLHDVVDDTSPNHYCEEELRQSHLHCFRSVKCTSCSEQELPCQVGFAPLRSVKRSLTVHHPDQDQDSPMVPSTGTSRIRVCEGNLSEGRRSIDSQDSGGCKMGSLSLMVVKCKGGEVSHAICTDHKLPCGNGQEIGDNWIDAECFSYEHYGHDLHREEYNSLSPSKDQEKYRGKYSLNKAGIQDVAFPAIIAFGNEGFFSENTDAESHIQGAHASVPIGLAGHRSDSNSRFTRDFRFCGKRVYCVED
ncbi:uncharacterized protein EMH_0051900 [Eimeria mitis]|uniref:Uncharacterized protein n=1 Tax=Eimeria mitis TaxID=44415 RepID=U6KDX8_9EIME|nr:uncharacterized protein EMH_0051900 [Eimeria mitis]CDJ36235.1 hypothetical protein, conserved [Eimeria mitis]